MYRGLLPTCNSPSIGVQSSCRQIDCEQIRSRINQQLIAGRLDIEECSNEPLLQHYSHDLNDQLEVVMCAEDGCSLQCDDELKHSSHFNTIQDALMHVHKSSSADKEIQWIKISYIRY